MDFFDIFFYLSVFAGIMMSFSLGANDVANSMASAVGAKAITIWQAVAIAGSMNFIGAAFLGSRVVDTVSKGILHGSITSNPELITLAMFAALLTAAFWVLFSSWTGFPVSSTQSVIGGLFGVGLVAGGFGGVQWSTMIEIFLTWVISPVLGGFISWFIYNLIKWSILNVKDAKQRMSAAQRWSPVWMGLAGGLIMAFLIFDVESGKHLREEAFWIGLSVVFAILFFWQTGKMMLKEHMQILQEKTKDAVEAIFRKMQVFTSAYVAISHGSNDVANAFGPVTAIYLIAKTGQLPQQGDVPISMLMLGGIGIAVGIAVLGKRVIKTVGEKITVLNNTKGFSADFSIATTLLLCSSSGIPASSTTVAVGSISGVGLADGSGCVKLKTLLRIVIMWILTIPVAGITGALFFWILKNIFL